MPLPPPQAGTLGPVPPRAVYSLVFLAVILAAAAVLRMLVGTEIGWPPPELLDLRLDRTVACIVVGAALAVGGVLLQSLLKNPLASPDLIGAAAGAGLAVMISVYLGDLAGGSILGPLAVGRGPAALAGSLAALAVVYLLAQRRGFVEPVSLVLVGVIVSVTCGAATLLLAHLMPSRTIDVGRWAIGTLSDEAGGWQLILAAAITLACIAAGMACARAMDVAALGDDEAQSTGVPIGRLRLLLFVLSGVLTAVAVALAGPIGFVGLVCPHVVRLMAGPGHRVLIPGAAMAGAALILLADAGTKAWAAGQGRMPIGIVTALLGGPVFIVLLRRGAGPPRES